MKHGLKYLALAGSVALLAGCGGGGGGDSTVNAYDQSVADARAAAAGIIETDTGALLVDARNNLPESGTASYEGFIGGDLDGAGLVGELSLEVAFAAGDNGAITGSATNFQHETDGAYTGTLTLNNGNVLPNGGAGGTDALAGDLEGTLSNGGVNNATNIALDGSFIGGSGSETPDAIAGGALGSVGEGLFEGIFIVKRP